MALVKLCLTPLYTLFHIPKTPINKMKPILSKWIIEGLPGFVFGSDKELYRLPFQSWPNHYGLRKIAKQSGNRWKLDGIWWSQRQLKNKLALNLSPEVLIDVKPELPF